MAGLIECVANVSEGRRSKVLDLLTSSITASGGRVLHVDPGNGANRTVFTFVMPVERSVECSRAFFETAIKHINMQTHTGTHPRLGAVDVFPLIALGDVSKSQVVELSNKIASEISKSLDLPIFLYEHSARTPERQALHNIRRGQFEGLAQKMKDPGWLPDYGPHAPHPTAGATVLGCRDFLIAYNVTLETENVTLARKIAAETRKLPGVRSIGWHIPEYRQSQISCNIIDFTATNPAKVFLFVKEKAEQSGTKVTGSELIGLIPKQAVDLSEATLKEHRSNHLSQSERVDIVDALGLDLHDSSFDIKSRTLEYLLT